MYRKYKLSKNQTLKVCKSCICAQREVKQEALERSERERKRAKFALDRYPCKRGLLWSYNPEKKFIIVVRHSILHENIGFDTEKSEEDIEFIHRKAGER